MSRCNIRNYFNFSILDDIRAVNGFDSIVSIIGIIFSFEISIDVIIGFLQFRTPLGIMMFYN